MRLHPRLIGRRRVGGGQKTVTPRIIFQPPKMFGLMRNFHRWASGRLRREITIIVIGLDNAGKSTLLATIAGGMCICRSRLVSLRVMQHPLSTRIKTDANAIIVPTIGQSRPITIKRDRSTVKFFDMGGGRTFRDVWSQYYESVRAS